MSYPEEWGSISETGSYVWKSVLCSCRNRTGAISRPWFSVMSLGSKEYTGTLQCSLWPKKVADGVTLPSSLVVCCSGTLDKLTAREIHKVWD